MWHRDGRGSRHGNIMCVMMGDGRRAEERERDDVCLTNGFI